eukprot:TRINITY_DN478_c0_g1_i1.p1 TRINITY_DN478_c0_g1~~TRINITY_DN478_c0_g1_i1.p1  ORF type:complete len:546 (+),score=99.66 TRINITY_DN478_c0_g1_i1:33-1640(+)
MQEVDLAALLERQVARVNRSTCLLPVLGPTDSDHAPDVTTMERTLPLVKQEILAAAAVAEHVPCADARGQCLKMAVDHLLLRLRLSVESCSGQRDGGGSSAQHSAKRSATSDSRSDCVLHEPVVLEAVLTFVGRGHWAFIAPTSKMLRAVYMRVLAVRDPAHLCTTSAHAALLSTASFRLAVETGLEPLSPGVQEQVGATGSIEMVKIAVTAGMPLGVRVLFGAAEAKRVGLLQYLRSCSVEQITNGHWVQMCCRAADHGDNGVALSWLSQQFEPCGAWPTWMMKALCKNAILGNNIDTLRWLFSDGAELFAAPVDSASGEDSVGHDGDYEILQVLCCGDVYKSPLHMALFFGAVDIAEFLLAEGNASAEDVHACWESATQCGVRALELLRQHGAINARGVKEGLKECVSVEVVKWVVGEGVWDWSSAAQRAQRLLYVIKRWTRKHADVDSVVTWMLSHGAQWPSEISDLLRHGTLDGRAVLRALRLGCPFGAKWTSDACRLLRDGPGAPERIKEIHDLGSPCACGRDQVVVRVV